MPRHLGKSARGWSSVDWDVVHRLLYKVVLYVATEEATHVCGESQLYSKVVVGTEVVIPDIRLLWDQHSS